MTFKKISFLVVIFFIITKIGVADNSQNQYNFFVGNFDLEKIKPLVEKYLGTLTSTGRNETWQDINMKMPKKKRNQYKIYQY